MCACGRQRRPALALVALSILLSLASAHQSLSKISMSRNVACRVGFGQNCPGPCPNTVKDFRLDMNKNNPAMTVKRGQKVVFRTLMNNHEGGFSRWTLVHAKNWDMWDHKNHARNAFLWTCGDTYRRKCSSRYRFRDCYYDQSGHHYTHYVTIPKIYPDGIYVLGWVWLGGGGTWGFFGDYYDCAYIEVKGGPLRWEHRPEFHAGGSPLSKDGKCTATVNQVGICWREPCPGGGRYTKLFKPEPFTNKRPKKLYRWMFNKPYRIPKSNVRVKSMTIRRIWNPSKPIHTSFSNSEPSRHPYLHVLEKHKITITCETEGPVKHVTFYTNGKKGRTDHDAPYSIAGDWKHWKTFVSSYARWKFRFDYRVTTISCKAVGYGWKNVAWHTMELSTK